MTQLELFLLIIFLVNILFYVFISILEYRNNRKCEISYQKSKERDRLLATGEKIGLEKGYEAGKTDARMRFVTFLEDQIRVLKNDE